MELTRMIAGGLIGALLGVLIAAGFARSAESSPTPEAAETDTSTVRPDSEPPSTTVPGTWESASCGDEGFAVEAPVERVAVSDPAVGFAEEQPSPDPSCSPKSSAAQLTTVGVFTTLSSACGYGELFTRSSAIPHRIVRWPSLEVVPPELCGLAGVTG
jgi:hypothetical protein